MFPNANLYPANHKTVFVLDHTPYFGISSEQHIEFDFIKSRAPGFLQVPPISKSLWTCSVEASIEYCRIVWDLFPTGKLIRFIASDAVAHILNTWVTTQQNLNHIMNGMSLIGVPPPPRTVNTPEFTIIHGLRTAIDALSEITELQVEKMANSSANGSTKFINRCRVVCITSARDDDSMKRLEEIFHNVLQQHNKTAINDTCIHIDHCHLVIINTFPISIESHVNNHPPKVWSPILTTEVHSVKCTLISLKLSTLILQHYNLASTTVTGIPMKEEQNASSSANYDVEIYHASVAHTAMLKGNAADVAGIRTIKEGLEYETVTLKWCTPRSCSASEMQNCTSMHRITPVDVNSRPSLCLINFLLNGRSVMLEMARKSGGKITSHLLAAHGGEIFIHTLCTARSVLEDPPSISEGCGGRVTDYRITDFGDLMKQNRLFPLKNQYQNEPPTSKMVERLTRHTKYWPLTISSTLIFNLKGFIDPLWTAITKDKLNDEEVRQCKQVVYKLFSLESKHEILPIPNAGQRIKGQKREDQYKIMWKELETLLKSNQHTENHTSVYICLKDCHKYRAEDKLSDKVELDQALRELDQLEPDHQRASVIRATTDSPMSPPPLASIVSPISRSTRGSGSIYSQKSLFDIFANQESKVKPRSDFYGRDPDSLKVKLYPNMKLDNERVVKGEAMVIE
ncbi:PREDICTED: protein asunder homolog [Nicrophorus vespilloides]|uniref:Protein asunder n=1 Tax=Nicrophorus vespilloides TaxID=110193 RepID=A0ABM1M224_NICVS|nr:PREDICTED: protein asunder homolog [Nicrophorus vespilloides]